MKIHNFIYILFFFVSHSSFGQEKFDLLINTFEDEALYGALELENGEFVLYGKRSDHTNYYNYQYGYIVKISSSGKILEERNIILPDSNLCIQKIIPTNDNAFLVISFAGDQIMQVDNIFYNNTITIDKYDTNLNPIFSKRIKAPIDSVDFFNIKTLLKENGNLVLFGGVNQHRGQYFDIDMYFIEINANGNLIKSNYYLSDNQNISVVFDMIEKKNSQGYYCLTRNPGGLIYNLKSNFDTISHISIPNNIRSTGDLKWFTDTTYIATGRCNWGNYPDIYDDSGVIILDTLHNIVNFNHFGKPDPMTEAPAPFKSIEYTIGDEFVYIAGTADYQYQNGSTGTSDNFIHFVKTDRELNPVFEKFYKGDAYYVTYYFTRTQDGGFLFLTTRYDYETQSNERDIYILKTDADGNLPTTGTEDDIIQETELIIYPNPGTAEITVRTASQALGGEFILCDILGKQVFQTSVKERFTSVSTNSLPEGVYVYKYLLNGKIKETGKWVKAEK